MLYPTPTLHHSPFFSRRFLDEVRYTHAANNGSLISRHHIVAIRLDIRPLLVPELLPATHNQHPTQIDHRNDHRLPIH